MAARAPLLSRVRPASGAGRPGWRLGALGLPAWGGAGWGGGRRAGDGGGARAALFAAVAACAGRARISHFSERGSEARWRVSPAGPHIPPTPRAPPPPPAPRSARGWQHWISRALSFIPRLLTKWKVNYRCREQRGLGPTWAVCCRPGSQDAPVLGRAPPGMPRRGFNAPRGPLVPKGVL